MSIINCTSCGTPLDTDLRPDVFRKCGDIEVPVCDVCYGLPRTCENCRYFEPDPFWVAYVKRSPSATTHGTCDEIKSSGGVHSTGSDGWDTDPDRYLLEVRGTWGCNWFERRKVASNSNGERGSDE